MGNPLADRIRPASLDEVVGQEHISGEGKLLSKIMASGTIPNLIFYGPSVWEKQQWHGYWRPRPTNGCIS